MSFAWQVPILAASASGFAVFNSLKEGWEKVVKFLIRPERSQYSIDDLGPTRFQARSGAVYFREDLQIENAKGQVLQASHWMPENDLKKSQRPTVVYLHSSYGSRIEVLELIPSLVEAGISVFAFDFSGCGMSEGSYVTLGSVEVHDVCSAVEYLQQKHHIKNIILWGRSMGAATAISYASRDHQIRLLISDSTYSSVRHLLSSTIGQSLSWMPSSVIDVGISTVKKTIQNRAAFDLDTVNTIESASKCSPTMSVLFAHSPDDLIVPMEQTFKVMEAVKGPKCLVTLDTSNDDTVDGQTHPPHTALRPKVFFDAAVEFILRSHSVPAINQDLNYVTVQEQPPAPPPTVEVDDSAFDSDLFNKIISGKGSVAEVQHVSKAAVVETSNFANKDLITAILLNISLVCIRQQNFQCGSLYSLAATFMDKTNSKGWYRAAISLQGLDHLPEALYCARQSEELGGGAPATNLQNQLKLKITNNCMGSDQPTHSGVFRIVCQYLDSISLLDSYQEVVDADADHMTADQLRVSGNTSLKTGDVQSALSAYCQALRQLQEHSSDIIASCQLSIDPEEVLVGSLAAVLVHPTSPVGYHYLMDSLITSGHTTTALRAGKFGMSVCPDSSSIAALLNTARGSAGGATA